MTRANDGVVTWLVFFAAVAVLLLARAVVVADHVLRSAQDGATEGIQTCQIRLRVEVTMTSVSHSRLHELAERTEA